MNAHVERRLDAWIAVIELAVVVSAVAAVFAIGMSLVVGCVASGDRDSGDRGRVRRELDHDRPGAAQPGSPQRHPRHTLSA